MKPILTLLLTITICSCYITDPGFTSVEVETDKSLYQLNETIYISIQNNSTHPIYLAYPPFKYEYHPNGEWKEYPLIWLAIALPPRRINENEAVEYEIPAYVVGTYRIRFVLGTVTGETFNILPHHFRTSNIFTVEEDTTYHVTDKFTLFEKQLHPR